jgi:hypothetical protein
MNSFSVAFPSGAGRSDARTGEAYKKQQISTAINFSGKDFSQFIYFSKFFVFKSLTNENRMYEVKDKYITKKVKINSKERFFDKKKTVIIRIR